MNFSNFDDAIVAPVHAALGDVLTARENLAKTQNGPGREYALAVLMAWLEVSGVDYEEIVASVSTWRKIRARPRVQNVLRKGGADAGPK
jgi:hypothetical protein